MGELCHVYFAIFEIKLILNLTTLDMKSQYASMTIQIYPIIQYGQESLSIFYFLFYYNNFFENLLLIY